MTWPEVRDAASALRVALLPVGAVEQHGPHLPLGTDWYIASHIACETAQKADRLLLPGINVGVSSEHQQFWGTLSLTPKLLADVAVSVCRSLLPHGLSRIVFVNGHGSNVAPLEDAARRLRQESVFAFVFNWWQSIESTLADFFPEPTAHAGSIETSLMLVIDPDSVRTERFKDADPATAWGTYVEGVLVGPDAIDFTKAGNVGDPALADREKGVRTLSAACQSLDRFCRWLTTRTDEELAARPHLG